jgi:predicted nucleic acid-binding protein
MEWIAGRKPASDKVAKLLSEADAGVTQLIMSAINSGEVYYCLRKNHSLELGESWRESSPTLPVTFEVPSAADIWNGATLKAMFSIAYADAFAAALAQKHACPLVTGDPEFRCVERLELDWIGAPARH